MNCYKCNRLLETIWSFCPYCGTEVCSDYFIDSRDGERYRTIKIGSQIWMAENLRYKCDGTHSYKQKNDLPFVKEYGLLYDWETAKDVAPKGWHLPSWHEFKQLEECVGNVNLLKKKEAWKKFSNSFFGFDALPAGCSAQGYDFGLGKFALFWTSSDEGFNSKESFFEIGNMDYDELGDSFITSASIRLVKDECGCEGTP